MRAFTDYVTSIAARYDVADVLYHLADQAVEVLAVDGVRVCVADDQGQLRMVASAGAQVSEAEPLGPCTDAHRTGESVIIEDLSDPGSDRAPIGRLDRGCVAGIPMTVQDRPIGALHLHRDTATGWRDEELEVARLFAAMAAGYLVNAKTLATSERLASQLQQALDSRVEIEQAKGILAERHRITPGEAFVRLRDHARDSNLRLRDVAAGIVDGSIRL